MRLHVLVEELEPAQQAVDEGATVVQLRMKGASTAEVVACGLDHQGESVLAWDAESGEPLSPIVVWQDKRSQEVLDRLGATGEPGTPP